MTAADRIVAGALNFRDVGGLPARAGVTRSGVLFRSGNLARLDDSGRATLRELGLRRVIDLRADDEVALEPSLVDGLGLETLRLPLFTGSAASFFEQDVCLDDFYRALLDEAADRVVEVVRGVLANQPVLVHCTVGKDRTGVTVALTLAAAGVAEDAVVADYARTEALLPPQRNARVLAYLRSQHPQSRHLEELATKSPAAAMRTLLDGLRERYGAPVEFLRAHGLGDDEIAELTSVLVHSPS
ncbi:tyrosine-protein phosphatase [Microbacterium sp. zg.Y1090]|uniref:tyrosine-protein phosphatase n=1 Tax=Microbacterium TaxID=33882 RepID=UPI00214D105C|nr:MULTISPECIES: tyrosine-protein phosphatase [unclassified Microbacterium]MCR2813513.1 tyrosine-protein phosphatase [Microbacterium sp. zg.Y1084]MCR2818150.1 tyrosine-protein phosphatase [Microbacterium sp. zg.Y1090]MDL5486672.1 tyrosine-protein phosphatase [Microbacterium sp. zg-Y1211]WIM27697.1 tyrosine-protein phosphatase [Microbacterium sp. zg-Y1090]